MADCVFCRIVSGQIKTEFLFKDDHVVCFKDINPAAPVHFLVAPVKHIPGPADLKDADRELLGRIYQAAAKVAGNLGAGQSGFRLVTNVGPDGGQEVPHIHVHVLGGRKLGWPPG